MGMQQQEEDRKNIASSIAGLSLLAKVKDQPPVGETPAEQVPEKNKKKSMKTIAQEGRMEEDAVEDLFKEFLKFCDSGELLNRKGFGRIIVALCPNRTIADSDVEAWWDQLSRQANRSQN